jgi:hypothetical protein
MRRKKNKDDNKKGKVAMSPATKQNKKDKYAKATTPKKKQNKKAGSKLLPNLMPPEYDVTIENSEDCEPFVHNELDVSVVRQACHEWSAKALVVWTVGAGSALLAGILDELPTVGLALCDTHLLMVAHVIDSEIANRMQVDFKGNKLYDADLHQRAVHAMGGDSDSEEKKHKGTKKKQGEDNQVDKESKANEKIADEDDDDDDDDESDTGDDSGADSSAE